MSLPGVPDNIALLEGPSLLGQFFGWGLFGILSIQMFIYSSNFPNERRPIKILVWAVFFAEVLQTIFGTHFTFVGLASGWGDLNSLVVVPWSIVPMPGICGLISSAVQIFFCWRIWVISKSKIIPGLIALVSLAQCGAALFCGINLGILGDFRKISADNNAAIVWLGGSAFCDIVICATLVVLLLRLRARSSFTRTSSIVAKLVQYTVETGMITAIAASLDLIVFLVLPSTNMHLLFFFMLSRLYANSMLATLNARAFVHGESNVVTVDVGVSTPSVEGLWQVREARNVRKAGTLAGVRVTTTIEEHAEELDRGQRMELAKFSRDNKQQMLPDV